MVDYAYVKIWGVLAGAVRWDARQQLGDFQYDSAFLRKGWDLSPLKMPISRGDRIYRFPELLPDRGSGHNTFSGLPGLLADVLPDKYGNILIDAWLARNGRAPQSMNPVEKLCFIGSRGMGALEFEPAQIRQNKNTFSIEVDSLVEAARTILAVREHFETSVREDRRDAVMDILKIGTSAGGARPKAVIAFNEKTQEVRSGQTKAPKGFEHWLLKLDGVDGEQFGESYGWGRVEYAYSLMAKACGLIMTDCRLLEENERAHFMTKRFDREGGRDKHHIQTLCGIRHYDFNRTGAYSYEQVFETMRQLRLTYPEAEQMFRRMAFNVLATNCDDHAKNFAFRLKKGGRWELAPAYDVCFSYDPKSIWVSQQTLSLNGKRKRIGREDFLTLGRANNIRNCEKILKEVNETVKAWESFAQKAEVREDLKKHIAANLHTI